MQFCVPMLVQLFHRFEFQRTNVAHEKARQIDVRRTVNGCVRALDLSVHYDLFEGRHIDAAQCTFVAIVWIVSGRVLNQCLGIREGVVTEFTL